MLRGDSLDGKKKVLTFMGRVCLIRYFNPEPKSQPNIVDNQFF